MPVISATSRRPESPSLRSRRPLHLPCAQPNWCRTQLPHVLPARLLHPPPASYSNQGAAAGSNLYGVMATKSMTGKRPSGSRRLKQPPAIRNSPRIDGVFQAAAQSLLFPCGSTELTMLNQLWLPDQSWSYGGRPLSLWRWFQYKDIHRTWQLSNE
ncbi:uncharacterized protein [Triticum aestivum]|uniref:uncharacterized protein isoform X2 n=1 Tax=Triticum aestivum TaxID=4565 RepID=UPI001D00CA6F|nr:uncharacterized protein LOC123184507 isoform X2 [Triticum aestivum]